MKGGGDAVSAAGQCCRPASSTTRGTCRSRTRFSSALNRAARVARYTPPAAPSNTAVQFLRSVDQWTASARVQNETPEPDGSRGARRSTCSSTRLDPGVRLRARGWATRNYLNEPGALLFAEHEWEFNVDKANQLLEAADGARQGWRAHLDGRPLVRVSNLHQRAAPERQQIIKAACQKAGIDLELKAVTPAVFFSSDVANPDTATKFYADLEMATYQRSARPLVLSEPVLLLGDRFQRQQVAAATAALAQRGVRRDLRSLSGEFDPVSEQRVHSLKRTDHRQSRRHSVSESPGIGAAAHRLRMTLSAWDSHLWLLKDLVPRGLIIHSDAAASVPPS